MMRIHRFKLFYSHFIHKDLRAYENEESYNALYGSHLQCQR